MRYKHILAVGASLITTFILLAILLYYFNPKSCPVGTFPCKNSTSCIPQRDWCNNEIDCPDGDDESTSICFDSNGEWLWYKKVQGISLIQTEDCPNVTKKYNFNASNIDDPGYHKNCSYKNCFVRCTELVAHEIAQALPEKTIVMGLRNSSFPVLKQEYFQRYTKLGSLYLKFNGIQSLEPNVFIGQHNLLWLVISNNSIHEIVTGHLAGLRNLEILEANSNEIRALDLTDLENSTKLAILHLSWNYIVVSNLKLPLLPALIELNLEGNRLESVTSDMFSLLPKLKDLSLESNQIQDISSTAFKNLKQLNVLNLKHNKILTIPPDLFASTLNLSVLFLGCNPIENLDIVSLSPLKENLKSLNVENIEMNNVEKGFFNMFQQLTFAYFKKFHYCTTYAPNVRICSPASDGVSSLSRLLGKSLLRSAVWGISCTTCLGNALVLWGRFTAKDENRVLSIVIRNLAVSDLLMGVYLFIIGFEDIRFRNSYNQEARTWMSSWSCTFIGMVAMTSSEVSVLILSFMSVERFMLIAAPLKGHRAITSQTAASAMIVVWVIGFTLALIPAIHWRSSTRFYGLNGMCFPLHIDDPFLVGWEYSVFIFLGVNLLGLIIISYVYAGMFVSIWKTRHATPLSVGDSEFALRFFLIVLTDVVCWAPIIILKILALAEYPVAPDLHAWVVVFILPINSAVNPLLYTFTTPKFRERLGEGWFGRVRNIVLSKQSRSGSQISNSYNNKTIMLSQSAKTTNDEKLLE